MNLHDNEEDFRNLIETTASHKKILSIYVEKDYWVTYALKQLSLSPFKDKVIFKGGTSLSKAYNMINRFSEDIDLVVLKKDGITPSECAKILLDLEEQVFKTPLVLKDHEQTNNGTRFRKKFYDYPIKFEGQDFGQVSNYILLELNSFANPDPIEKRFIKSYVTEFLESRGDHDDIKKYGLEPIELYILSISRTFVEKMMCVAGISNVDDKKFTGLKAKVRHFYDIHKIIQSGEIDSYLTSDSFHITIDLVYNEDKNDRYTKDNWPVDVLLESKLFLELEEIIPELKEAYNGDFQKMMVHPDSEKFDGILESFIKLKSLIPRKKMIYVPIE